MERRSFLKICAVGVTCVALPNLAATDNKVVIWGNDEVVPTGSVMDKFMNSNLRFYQAQASCPRVSFADAFFPPIEIPRITDA